MPGWRSTPGGTIAVTGLDTAQLGLGIAQMSSFRDPSPRALFTSPRDFLEVLEEHAVSRPPKDPRRLSAHSCPRKGKEDGSDSTETATGSSGTDGEASNSTDDGSGTSTGLSAGDETTEASGSSTGLMFDPESCAAMDQETCAMN